MLLIVLLLRSFLVEPFRIPSGSMKPTLLVGDFILVNKFTYGIRLPVVGTKIIDWSAPKRGDVMVFKYPVNPQEYFIKRVIGLPGDTIEYKNKTLYINGELIEKQLIDKKHIIDEYDEKFMVNHWREQLPGLDHEVYERLSTGRDVIGVKVPLNHYFMMGDNRDDSDDSRIWGFVPESDIVGQAFAIWLSWDGQETRVRWGRMGTAIH